MVGGRFIRRNTRHGAGSDKDKGEAVDRLQSKVQGRGSRVEGRESGVMGGSEGCVEPGMKLR